MKNIKCLLFALIMVFSFSLPGQSVPPDQTPSTPASESSEIFQTIVQLANPHTALTLLIKKIAAAPSPQGEKGGSTTGGSTKNNTPIKP
jgi:hypothetical protein